MVPTDRRHEILRHAPAIARNEETKQSPRCVLYPAVNLIFIALLWISTIALGYEATMEVADPGCPYMRAAQTKDWSLIQNTKSALNDISKRLGQLQCPDSAQKAQTLSNQLVTQVEDRLRAGALEPAMGEPAGGRVTVIDTCGTDHLSAQYLEALRSLQYGLPLPAGNYSPCARASDPAKCIKNFYLEKLNQKRHQCGKESPSGSDRAQRIALGLTTSASEFLNSIDDCKKIDESLKGRVIDTTLQMITVSALLQPMPFPATVGAAMTSELAVRIAHRWQNDQNPLSTENDLVTRQGACLYHALAVRLFCSPESPAPVQHAHEPQEAPNEIFTSWNLLEKRYRELNQMKTAEINETGEALRDFCFELEKPLIDFPDPTKKATNLVMSAMVTKNQETHKFTAAKLKALMEECASYYKRSQNRDLSKKSIEEDTQKTKELLALIQSFDFQRAIVRLEPDYEKSFATPSDSKAANRTEEARAQLESLFGEVHNDLRGLFSKGMAAWHDRVIPKKSGGVLASFQKRLHSRLSGQTHPIATVPESTTDFRQEFDRHWSHLFRMCAGLAPAFYFPKAATGESPDRKILPNAPDIQAFQKMCGIFDIRHCTSSSDSRSANFRFQVPTISAAAAKGKISGLRSQMCHNLVGMPYIEHDLRERFAANKGKFCPDGGQSSSIR